jgi:cephalosporin hydroxylase
MENKAKDNLTRFLTIIVLFLCIILIISNIYKQVPSIRTLLFDKTVNSFHELFYNSNETWLKNTWFGIQAGQNPNDVWITQEIISEIKPDFIVETGTAVGGSALLWATILAQINPQGKVITIDIEDKTKEARRFAIAKDKIEFIIGSSADTNIINSIKKRVAGKKVLVILDSDHSRAHVLNELSLYWEMVPVGSYLIVQDTNINGHPVYHSFGPGPMEAVNEFLSTNDKFVADQTRERLLFTMHPRGYLKRVKS